MWRVSILRTMKITTVETLVRDAHKEFKRYVSDKELSENKVYRKYRAAVLCLEVALVAIENLVKDEKESN